MQNRSVVVLTSTATMEASLRRIRQAIPELQDLLDSLCGEDPRFEQVSEILRSAIVAESWMTDNGEIGGDKPGHE